MTKKRSAPPRIDAAAAPAGVRTEVDYDRLLDALLNARGAFGAESDLRRVENLPALTLWTNVLRLDAAVRELRNRLALASGAAPPVLKRREQPPGEDE